MGKFFGTDGVRGVANTELTPELAFYLGSGLTHFVGRKNNAPEILIGMDTRRSGQMLEAAFLAGVLSAGGNVRTAGVIPTPAIAYLTRKYGLDAGVMITASHNPFLDNGIKLYDRNGFKLGDEDEKTIEQDIMEMAGSFDIDDGAAGRSIGGEVGIKLEAESAFRDYVEHIKSTLNGQSFEGFNVTLDCANGAMYKAAPLLFQEIGAKTDLLASQPNGENINLRCGSTYIRGLTAQVLKNGSCAGFAFDGDGDRCLAVDEKGNIVDGDQILSILANHYKSKGFLHKNTLVATVMSNMGLVKMCEDKGLHLERTPVGDKYVLKSMVDNGYILGGEQSGHIINLNHSTTGEGLCTACELMAVMKETGQKLSELASVMEKYPQVLRNVRVSNERKSGYLASSEITGAISALEERFEGHGRVLVRPSGTEPLVRVMIEGRDLEEITRDAEALARLIEDILS